MPPRNVLGFPKIPHKLSLSFTNTERYLVIIEDMEGVQVHVYKKTKFATGLPVLAGTNMGSLQDHGGELLIFV